MNKIKLLFLIVVATVGMNNTRILAQNSCAGFKTFTQGGWGADCHGNNPGCYLEANFNHSFSNVEDVFSGVPAHGFTIGCGSNTLTFATAQEVQDFLPAGGPPSVLPSISTLSAQLVALTLNVQFDLQDPNFASNPEHLANLIIGEGPFVGWTVSAFLVEANKIVGGCASDFSYADANTTATAINENFDDGTVNHEYLICKKLEVSLNVTASVLCFGASTGAINSTVTGGTAPYTYSWSNDGTSGEGVAEMDGAILVVSASDFATTPNLSGLAAGTYTLTVTDANGSTAVANVTITQPTELVATATAIDVTCFGGSDGTATVTVSGGVEDYTVLWSTGSSEYSITGLTADAYTVSATDANGCVVNTAVVVSQPELLVASAIITDVTCAGANDGSLSLSIIGGTAPYAILWSNGFSTPGLSALTAGIYSATITDVHNCAAGVNAEIIEPLPLSVSTTKADVTCYGGLGTATAVVTGGTAPYSYLWNTGETEATASFPVGTYTVIVTDANACTSSASATLVLLSCEGFTTVTQGGYGAACNGNNWGCYRNANFATAFPTGLTVGACGKFIKLTSAAAVDAFLPNSGSPKALSAGTLVNPTTVKNTLAGQVVALTLNIAFDLNDQNFGASTSELQDLIIISGLFQGWSVGQVLAEGNNALGGCSSYSAADITNVIDAINRNYDNRTVNLGFLACSCEIEGRQSAVIFSAPVSNDGLATLSAYPNPAVDNSTIEFSSSYTSFATVEVYNNTTGQLVATIFSGNVSAGDTYNIPFNTVNLNNGIYIVKMLTDKNIQTKQLVIMK